MTKYAFLLFALALSIPMVTFAQEVTIFAEQTQKMSSSTLKSDQSQQQQQLIMIQLGDQTIVAPYIADGEAPAITHERISVLNRKGVTAVRLDGKTIAAGRSIPVDLKKPSGDYVGMGGNFGEINPTKVDFTPYRSANTKQTEEQTEPGLLDESALEQSTDFFQIDLTIAEEGLKRLSSMGWSLNERALVLEKDNKSIDLKGTSLEKLTVHAEIAPFGRTGVIVMTFAETESRSWLLFPNKEPIYQVSAKPMVLR